MKLWRRREAELLAQLDEEHLKARWRPLESAMLKCNLAPDEVVLVNELYERAGPLDAYCERRSVTYCEWEERGDEPSNDPLHARAFGLVPEAAWSAREDGALLCRKVALRSPEAVQGWRGRLR